jgi:hypothetical protein
MKLPPLRSLFSAGHYPYHYRSADDSRRFLESSNVDEGEKATNEYSHMQMGSDSRAADTRAPLQSASEHDLREQFAAVVAVRSF